MRWMDVKNSRIHFIARQRPICCQGGRVCGVQDYAVPQNTPGCADKVLDVAGIAAAVPILVLNLQHAQLA